MSLDVAIVGRGPVALMLAIQFQSRGIRWMRLDDESSQELADQVVQLSDRCLDMFDHLGLLHEALNCRLIGQLEQALEHELTRLGGMTRDSGRLVGFERNFSGVEVEWKSTPGTQQKTQCRYLIGCDGPESLVRQRLGLSLQNERRQAEHYRQGNVFLAGEAAHEQGLSEGLEDAVNLGWKLASVLRGDALDRLLDSYQTERRDSGEERLESVVGLLAPGASHPLRLSEFLRHGDFQLIGFGGEWEGLAALAEHLAGIFGNQIHCLAVVQPGELPPAEPLAWVQDSQKQAWQAWGEGPGAMLVRPDGYVGWRGRPHLDANLERFLSLVCLNLPA